MIVEWKGPIIRNFIVPRPILEIGVQIIHCICPFLIASDQWCEGRPSDDYPSSLVSVPTNLPTSSTKKSINSAIHHNGNVALILFSILFMAAILFELNQ